MSKDMIDVLMKSTIGNHWVFDKYKISNKEENYPFYNIIMKDKNTCQIDLAVAGFDPTELSVTQEGDAAIIEGKRIRVRCPEPELENINTYIRSSYINEFGKEVERLVYSDELENFAHRGFALRDFRRRFFLTEGWTVKSSFYKNGVLTVVLSYDKPEQEKPVPIKIET